MVDPSDSTSGTRQRIVAAAAQLLAEQGRDAVSTRAVSAAAGVQAPTLYRLFGDKQGLLDAVVAYGFQGYLDAKTDRRPTGDPLQDLRAGWDLHIGFGLASPALYSLMYGEPRPGAPSPAAAAAWEILAQHIRAVAEAGRLGISEERAAHLVHAAGCGTTFMLIALPEDRRDPALSELAREMVIAAITTGTPAPAERGPVAAAVALRAALPALGVLSPPEQGLLREWLERVIQAPRAEPARAAAAEGPAKGRGGRSTSG